MQKVRPTKATHGQPQQVKQGKRSASLVRLLVVLMLAASSMVVIQAVLAPKVAQASGEHIDSVTFQRDVDPASARFLTDAIDTAQSDGANMLLITLDTPGGDLDSMKQITQKEINATIPIVVYIAPQEARAGSAGTFIALAAPIVAMAQNTRIGAASPVDSSGQNLESTLDTKIKQDLEAQLTSNQTTFHRNVAMAIETVENAKSFTVQQAIQGGLVNFGAATQTDLLNTLDGMNVTLATGSNVTLHTANVPITELQPTVANQLEALILDPTVLFILFALAAICIFLELSHPGAIVPGTVGTIALIIFLFGAGSLSPNWTGLALMVLAVVLLVIDVRVPTHGVLTVGALISLIVGSLIFFDTGTDQGAVPVNNYVVFGVAAGMGLIALMVLRYALLSRRGPRIGGADGLLNQTAIVTLPLSPTGRVKVMGEDWAAQLAPKAAAHNEPIAANSAVRVKARQGLTLIVEPEPKVIVEPEPKAPSAS